MSEPTAAGPGVTICGLPAHRVAGMMLVLLGQPFTRITALKLSASSETAIR